MDDHLCLRVWYGFRGMEQEVAIPVVGGGLRRVKDIAMVHTGVVLLVIVGVSWRMRWTTAEVVRRGAKGGLCDVYIELLLGVIGH